MAFDNADLPVTASPRSSDALVDVRDLTVTFVSRESSTRAVNGVSFTLAAGEVLCIIGESGSGKSVTLRALMGLLPPTHTRLSGGVRVGEHDILAMTDRQLREVRGSRISMIFQEPMTALDPVYTIGEQITETVIRHEGHSKAAARHRSRDLPHPFTIPSPHPLLPTSPHPP